MHIAGVNYLLQSSLDTVIDLIQIFRSINKPISFGLCAYTIDDSSILRDIINPNDIIFCSRGELSCLCNKEVSGYGLVNNILNTPFNRLIVTLGSMGALVKWPDYDYLIVEPPKVKAVCSVGAGDIFSGVFFSEYLLGSLLGEAVRKANYCAAMRVRHKSWYTWFASVLRLTLLYIWLSWS